MVGIHAARLHPRWNSERDRSRWGRASDPDVFDRKPPRRNPCHALRRFGRRLKRRCHTTPDPGAATRTSPDRSGELLRYVRRCRIRHTLRATCRPKDYSRLEIIAHSRWVQLNREREPPLWLCHLMGGKAKPNLDNMISLLRSLIFILELSML